MTAVISANQLRELVVSGEGELALLDVREEGQFGVGHLLWAVNAPYSSLELVVGNLVPRRSCQVVLMDQGDGIAALAARRLGDLGYCAVSILDGGVASWHAAGYALFHGVYVSSKAFGEWIEHAARTPSISAEALQRLIADKGDVIVLDPRTVQEHAVRHVPGAVACPSAELIHRYHDLVPSSDTLVVVACGGRTRGIVGAQTLIDAAVPNRVVALKDGNHGWVLAGLSLETGAQSPFGGVSEAAAERAQITAAGLARRSDILATDVSQLTAWLSLAAQNSRTTFALDVRSPEEYHSGHFPGARSAPGGQLIQATDRWLGTLGARVVLIDDDGVRAVQTAHWLKKMGWEVHTLRYDAPFAERQVRASKPDCASALSADKAARVEPHMGPAVKAVPEVAAQLAAKLLEQGALAVCLDRSDDFLLAHPPGAVWTNRARLAADLPRFQQARSLLLFSRDARLAHLSAIDLAEFLPGWHRSGRLHVVEGGQQAWTALGLPTVASAEDVLPQGDRIDFLFWTHDRRRGNTEAMRTYLDWEKQLLGQAQRDHASFPCFRGRAAAVAPFVPSLSLP